MSAIVKIYLMTSRDYIDKLQRATDNAVIKLWNEYQAMH